MLAIMEKLALKKTHLMFLAKTMFTAIVIFLLYSQIDFQIFVSYFHRLDVWHAISAVALFCCALYLSTVRWHYIIKATKTAKIPLFELMRQVFVGFSLSQALPSSIGGDVYRVYLLKKYTIPLDKSISIVFLDRFYGLIGFITLSALVMPLYKNVLWGSLLGKTILFAVLGAMLGIIAMIGVHKAQLEIVKKIKFIETTLTDFYQTIISPYFVHLFIITLITVLAMIGSCYFLAYDLEIQLTFTHLLLIIPLVFFVSVIPISFAGWGIREGAMVIFMDVFDVPKEAALALSVTIGMMYLVAAVPGVLMWIFMKKPISFESYSDE